MEFLTMVSMSALLLAALYGLTASKQLEISRYQQTQAADAVAEDLGFQVEMALVQGEGYSRKFSVPVKISGKYYNLSAGHSQIILETENSMDRRPTLYDGDWVNVTTRKSNTYRIYNTGELDVKPVD
jgi:hypothetical protein